MGSERPLDVIQEDRHGKFVLIEAIHGGKYGETNPGSTEIMVDPEMVVVIRTAVSEGKPLITYGNRQVVLGGVGLAYWVLGVTQEEASVRRIRGPFDLRKSALVKEPPMKYETKAAKRRRRKREAAQKRRRDRKAAAAAGEARKPITPKAEPAAPDGVPFMATVEVSSGYLQAPDGTLERSDVFVVKAGHLGPVTMFDTEELAEAGATAINSLMKITAKAMAGAEKGRKK